MTEQDQAFVSIHQLAKMFEKIYAGLNVQQLAALDKELIKMYPSEESEVWFYADYDEEDNTVGISIYMNHPLLVETIQPISFEQLMNEYLIKASPVQLPQLADCLVRWKKKKGKVTK